MSDQFEYKSMLLRVNRKWGIWTQKVDVQTCGPLEDTLNALGREGWELVGVFPITDGGSPAQISSAIHHFKRPLIDR